MTRTQRAGGNKGAGAPSDESARERLLADLADGVTELVDKVVVVTNGWRVEEPGLIAQLREEMWRGTKGAGDGRGGGYGSRTPGTAMLSLLESIDRGSRDLVLGLGGQPRAGSAETLLRQVVGLATVSDHVALRRSARSVEHWVSSARIMLSWDTRWVNLRIPCPYCEHYALKVRADLSTPVRCMECTTEWDRNAWGVFMDMADTNTLLHTVFSRSTA